MKQAIITWRDSMLYNEQTELQEYPIEVIISIGWLIIEDKDRVVIARDKIGNEWRGVVAIPRENIVKLLIK